MSGLLHSTSPDASFSPAGSTAWLADHSYLASAVGAVSRTAASKFGDIVSVKDFGAIGDGSTNDTTALVNAIAAAKSQKALLVWPSGTYLTDQLTLTSDHYFLALGYVVIKANDGLNQDIFRGSSVARIYMSGLILDGNKPSTTSRVDTFGQGLHLLKGSNVTLLNMRGTNCLENAFRIIGIDDFYFANLEADNCAHNGIYMAGHTDGTALQHGLVVGAYAHDNAIDGIDVEFKCNDITLVAPRSDTNGFDHSLYVGGGGYVIDGTDTSNYPQHVTLINPMSTGNYAGGIYILGCVDVNLVNPVSHNDGSSALIAETTYGMGIAIFQNGAGQQPLRDIAIINPLIENSGKHGIWIEDTFTGGSSRVQISGGGIIRNSGQKSANSYDGINAAHITNLEIGDIAIYDDQGTQTMRYAATIAATCTSPRIALTQLGSGASGTLNNSSASLQLLMADKNLVWGSDALATTATDGFLYIPGCNGAPSGTPTTFTGRCPLVVDTNLNQLYFYSGGSWRNAGP